MATAPAGGLQACFEEAMRLQRAGQADESLRLYGLVLDKAPRHTASLYNSGLLRRARGEADQALALWRRALEVDPSLAHVHTATGKLLLSLGRTAEAAAAFDQALAVQPENVDALNCRGNAARFMGRAAESLGFYDRALAVSPDYGFALVNRGHALALLGRSEAAIDSYRLGLAADRQGNIEALGARFAEQLRICDWSDYDTAPAEILAELRRGRPADLPFNLLVYGASAADQLEVARTHTQRRMAAAADATPLPPRGPRPEGRRLRIAYVSADFRNHAVAHLIGAMFAHHDAERFEIHGFALAPAAQDENRARIAAAIPHFHDVSDRTDRDIARRIRELEIDIAVDLNGYTTHCQPGIFARRCAPLQINYLGYPGTMGAPFMDYILADGRVAPPGSEAFYSEAVIRLPHSYQVNGPLRPAAPTPNRAAAGLPSTGFVFCCFNANFKILPPVFEAWMRLLVRTPGSVLWMLETGAAAKANLRAEAARRGIDPDRLVFAPKVDLEAHLARHRLADLFLDTAPYNAHTTASDALRMGLPLVTWAGETFASRVAASLLHAVGLPDLVTDSLEAYEALAADLAHDAARLAAIRQRLADQLPTSPLFDTRRFARDLEAAYARAWARHEAGEPPAGFDL